MHYNWDLIERLLHEVQKSADEHFAPRLYAQELAAHSDQTGHPVSDVDALKAQATRYEAQLLEAGFIAPRPEIEGGNGENFVLTPRGLQLLSMIDSSLPGEQHPRQVLESHGLAALTPEVFDTITVEAL